MRQLTERQKLILKLVQTAKGEVTPLMVEQSLGVTRHVAASELELLAAHCLIRSVRRPGFFTQPVRDYCSEEVYKEIKARRAARPKPFYTAGAARFGGRSLGAL